VKTTVRDVVSDCPDTDPPRAEAVKEEQEAFRWATPPDLFEGIPHSDCLRILSTGCLKDIRSSEVIFQAGDPKAIFLMIEGLAKVTQVTEGGVEVLLWINGAGRIIGAIDLASCIQVSTAKALEVCKVIAWNLRAFEYNLDRFPTFCRNVVRVGARQIEEMSCRICEVSTEEAMPRLARSLIRLSEQIGRHVNGQLEIGLTQEALAQMTAMNMYALNRHLSKWQKQQLVICQKGSIVIRDLHGLKHLCRAVA
jgi:CRP/FNR family cyclic AMP-dependent transcriptional regulator